MNDVIKKVETNNFDLFLLNKYPINYPLSLF